MLSSTCELPSNCSADECGNVRRLGSCFFFVFLFCFAVAASAAVAALAAGLLGGWAATPTAAPLQQPCCLPLGCHLGISLRSLIFHISFHICHVFFVQVVASFVDMFKLWSSVSFCHVVFVLCCRLHVYMDDGNSICDHDLMFCFAFSDSKKLKTLRDPPPSERCSYTVFFFFDGTIEKKQQNAPRGPGDR